MDKQDMELICKECNRAFVWTSGQQNFMDGLLKDGKIPVVKKPRFCIPCNDLVKRTVKENKLG